MSVPILTLFNNKGGVGKTTLTAHLAALMGRQDHRILVADLDPQYNLSAMLLSEQQIEGGCENQEMVFDAMADFHEDGAEIKPPRLWTVDENVFLLATDLRQSEFEERYASSWSLAKHDNEFAIEQLLGFQKLLLKAAEQCHADLVIVDLGPQLSAVNRAILIHCTHLIVPLTANRFAIRALEILGPTLRSWQQEWNTIIAQSSCSQESPPGSNVQPIGYVLNQTQSQGPQQSAELRALAHLIPRRYHRHLLNDHSGTTPDVNHDDQCLAVIRNFQSLLQLSQGARKLIFDLQPGDGAIGAHGQYVHEARKNLQTLCDRILEKIFVLKS